MKWFLEQLPDASIRFAKAIPMDAKLNGGTTLQVTQFGSTLRSLDRGHLVTIGVSAQPIQRRPVGWQEIEAMSFHDPEQ